MAKEFGWKDSPLSPLVLRVFPLELGLDTWIVLSPETREILRDLHRPHAGRKDMDTERNTALGNTRRLSYSKEFLDAQRYISRTCGLIDNLRSAAIRQCHTLGSVLVQQFLLCARQPR